MPKVGIVMRTKDRPATLARALNSALAQSFGDWHVALVNDGGDFDALEAYVDREVPQIRPRLSIVHHDKPKGRWPAANAGVAALDCDYLVLLDDDDSWDPRFLEVTTGALSQAGPGIGGVCTRAIEVFEEIRDGVPCIRRRQPLTPEVTAISIAALAQMNRIVTNSFLYRRALHDELGLYDGDLPVLGDWDFYLRVIRRYDIRLLEDALAHVHKRLDTGSGAYANSVIGAVNSHHETAAFLRNRYLRQDMDAGLIGMGTLMALGLQSQRVDEIVQISLRRSGLGRTRAGLRRLAGRLGLRGRAG